MSTRVWREAPRVALAVAGLALLAWGVVLVGELALPAGPHTLRLLGWLVGGPLVHDLLLAPVVGLAGLALSRFARPAWRAPLTAGAVISGVLVLLSVPLLWRRYGAPPSPGLHEGGTGTGLLIALALVWAIALIAGTTRHLRRRRGVGLGRELRPSVGGVSSPGRPGRRG
ncbi:hypothetical protein [Amycolatopsis aidingensis]|uniref:hypothetical protein n=1 Tax=Amycolatopsis aidingensis TaxID=2842453 RepID=UPI001C0BFB77|nr:hypothetical protein [Amycolatopsis aidingensis]